MHSTQIKLTERQQQILEYLRSYQRENGVMPSSREIQQHFRFGSQTAAMSHLRALEKRGAIRRLPNKARAVSFPEDINRDEWVDIPLYGSIAAGYAEMQQQEPDGSLSLDAGTVGLRRGSKAFALKVRGESMIGANICARQDAAHRRRRDPRAAPDGDCRCPD